MPRFSKRSRDRLATCHPDIQRVLNDAIQHTDFTVLCGYRGEHAQNLAVDMGRSKVRFPNSKHNAEPSSAVDIAPWPIDWDDPCRFYLMATHIFSAAIKHDVKIRWGGLWRSFKDLPHFELRV